MRKSHPINILIMDNCGEELSANIADLCMGYNIRRVKSNYERI